MNRKIKIKELDLLNTKIKNNLLKWYEKNKRDLPWRRSNDPYLIWISEVMLQQTTVKAVIPYYEKFLNRFPTIQKLAKAPIKEVYKFWSGLGYYSRADNLHKASKILAQTGFPKTHEELLKLPGFGPYTARAVASFAFKNPSGVLDGNVIRFLSRFYGISSKWWEPKERDRLQRLSDEWVQEQDSSQINQALIEIGATICLSKNPSCFLCPLKDHCKSFKENTQDAIPLKKPRRKKEIWIWEPLVIMDQDRIALTKNPTLPVLKGKFIFPGAAKKVLAPPAQYNYKHCITHHDIYVQIHIQKNAKSLYSKSSQTNLIQQKNKKQVSIGSSNDSSKKPTSKELTHMKTAKNLQRKNQAKNNQKHEVLLKKASSFSKNKMSYSDQEKGSYKWVSIQEIKEHNPATLIQKALQFI